MNAHQLTEHYAEIRRRLYGVPQPSRRAPIPLKVEPDLTPRMREGRISASEIIARVARWHGVSVADIRNVNRFKRIVRARQCAMYWTMRRCGYSLTQTGRAFNRDHTTVLHGVRAHENTRWWKNHERNNPSA